LSKRHGKTERGTVSSIKGRRTYDRIDYSFENVQEAIKEEQDQSEQAQKEVASTVLTWGSKKDYRVCKGQPYLNMTKITSIKNILSVACGCHHTLVVTQEGKLYGWGKNTEKQISPSCRESISSPAEVHGLGEVKAAAAGWGHSLVLDSEGRVYAWGYGKDGQLGLGHR
jgi:alpha-tubulin suppressor-like RCC1 family protein